MHKILYQNQGLGEYQKEGMYSNCIFSKFVLKSTSYNKAGTSRESKDYKDRKKKSEFLRRNLRHP